MSSRTVAVAVESMHIDMHGVIVGLGVEASVHTILTAKDLGVPTHDFQVASWRCHVHAGTDVP